MIDLTGMDRITSLLTSFLDVQSLRAQVASSNIANLDTPGYQARELDFSDYLRQAAYSVATPNAANARYQDVFHQMSAPRPTVVAQTGNAIGIDGNTVDMGREMATIADAGMQYMTGINLLQSRLRLLRTAIREGR